MLITGAVGLTVSVPASAVGGSGLSPSFASYAGGHGGDRGNNSEGGAGPGSASFAVSSSGPSTSTAYFLNYGRVESEIRAAAGSPAEFAKLEANPVEAETTVSTEPGIGGDPVMVIAKTETSAVGIPIFKWEVNQGFSDNGSVITNVAPANDCGLAVYYPGWSLGNWSWGMGQPATGVWAGQTNANFAFSY